MRDQTPAHPPLSNILICSHASEIMLYHVGLNAYSLARSFCAVSSMSFFFRPVCAFVSLKRKEPRLRLVVSRYGLARENEWGEGVWWGWAQLSRVHII